MKYLLALLLVLGVLSAHKAEAYTYSTRGYYRFNSNSGTYRYVNSYLRSSPTIRTSYGTSFRYQYRPLSYPSYRW